MTRSPSLSPLPERQATTLAATIAIRMREINRRADGSVMARQMNLAAASAGSTLPTRPNVRDPVNTPYMRREARECSLARTSLGASATVRRER
jgi:hypothetical protein